MKRLCALALSLVLLLTGCASSTPSGQGSGMSAQSVDQSQPLPTPEPEPEPEPEPIVSHLMVAGDIMSHTPVVDDAYVAETDRYDFSHMYQDAAVQLAGADYAIANLETPLAGGPEYLGYPVFDAPDELAYDTKAAGFDLVSTANNHSRDQGMDGLYRTLDILDQAGLAHVGTYRSQEERDQTSGIYVADVGGISVALLSYTYGLNGFRLDSDKMYAVNLFNLDYYTTLANPDYELLKSDLAAARALDTDLIAVMIHWGNEYKNAPNSHQTNLAQFLVEQGADLILGGHPHVLEPYETITATGWDGRERQGFVIYSLGNFISNQLELETKTTVILDLELTKDPDGNTALTDVRYTPYYMLHRNDLPVGQKRHLVNIHQAMADYEAGTSQLITAQNYTQLQAALEHCHTILGEAGDLPSELSNVQAS